jgi:hypothetical protein
VQIPSALLTPDFRVSSNTDLHSLRNRDLDASLKELIQAFKREKERQDRLTKIRRIQRFQECIQLQRNKCLQLEEEINNPVPSKKPAKASRQRQEEEREQEECPGTSDEETDEEEEEDEDSQEAEGDSEESTEDQPQPNKRASKDTPEQAAASFLPLLEEPQSMSVVETQEREDEVVVPLVFNKKALDILAPLQRNFLEKCYPSLSFQEVVPGVIQEQDQDFSVEPGVSTEDQGEISTAEIPAAPIHASVLKKTREITHRMRAKEPKGAQLAGCSSASSARPPSRSIPSSAHDPSSIRSIRLRTPTACLTC